MANEVMSGLFGLSPYQVQQQQYAADEARANAAADAAGQTPGQMMARAYSGMGSTLGRGAAGMMGMVNPAEEQAKAQQQAISGLDTSSPEAILQRASQIQDPRLKIALTQFAQQVQEKQQELATKRSIELKNLREGRAAASPLGKIPLEKTTPESRRKYLETGNIADLEFIDSEKQGAEYMQLMKAIENPNITPSAKMALQERMKYLTTHGAGTNVSVKLPEQEKGFETALGKQQAEELIKGRAAADDAVDIINTVNTGREILKKGIVSGFGANTIVGVGQALKQAGIDFGGDATANSQAYASNMAQNVGKLIKQFGAGTGLSDADRQYATKMAGGEITLDEKAIRKILDINETAAKNIIRRHNERAKGVKTNIPLSVEMPEQKTAPVSDLAGIARAELAKRRGQK